ncbi:hypothetical protein MASR2M48_23490 [Spirochaetota bacterium]
MSIFIDRTDRVLVQGITGSEGSFWSRHMMELGTQVVSGVTPGKEGQSCGRNTRLPHGTPSRR